jgi:SEC-C motif-containing protein
VRENTAATATALMRSRYEAYVSLDADYLLATWHPSTRPANLELEPGMSWQGLEIIGATGGGALDTEGTVEFRALYRGGELHENSRFVKVDRRWLYLDGVLS